MSEDPQRIDPITAERLMRDARTGSPVGSEPLADLLAAAAAPARPGELAGEEAAVTAFLDAHLELTPQPRRRSMLKSVLAKTSVVAAVAVVGGGGVGVALAAGTGHLPGTGSPDDHAVRATSSATSGTPAHMHTGKQSSRPAVTGTHRTRVPSHDAKSGGSPSPSLRGLCTAFRARSADNPGKALDDPAFRMLIRTAGGRDNVASYCRTLLAKPSGRPSHHSGRPSTQPTTHQTSHPTSHPSRPNPSHSHPIPSKTNSHIP